MRLLGVVLVVFGVAAVLGVRHRRHSYRCGTDDDIALGIIAF